jgi:hypothetical protein
MWPAALIGLACSLVPAALALRGDAAPRVLARAR